MKTASPPVSTVGLAELVVNPDNPRSSLDDLEELAASIAVSGLLQPLLVVALPTGGFMVVDGHRRHAAMCSIDYAEPIPVVVTDMDREARVVAAVSAGSHARALSPIDQAKAFQQLRDMGLTMVQITERTGVHAVHGGRMTLEAAKLATYEIGRRAPDKRPRPPRAMQASYVSLPLCPECGQVLKDDEGSKHDRVPMGLACADCEFETESAPEMIRHTMKVHKRRASRAERTPTRRFGTGKRAS